MVDLSVVLPAYNENAVVAGSLTRLTRYLDEARAAGSVWDVWEILLVDDGSEDGTGQAARVVSRRDPRVRIITLRRNRGKGGAIREGVARARGSIIVVTDTDLSYALEDIGRAVAMLSGTPSGGRLDMVTGDRRHPESRVALPLSDAAPRVRRRQSLSRLFNAVTRLVFGLDYGDTQCGLKAFRGEAARRITSRLRTRGFLSDIEMFIIADRLGLRVGRIPVHLTYLSDATTVNVVRLLPRVLVDGFRIRAAQLLKRYDRTRKGGTAD